MKTLVATKSSTAAFLPIVMALNALTSKGVEGFIPQNIQQELLLKYVKQTADLEISDGDIESLCSNSVRELNQFLQKHGFDIQLDGNEPFDFGVATIANFSGQWFGKANPTTVTCDETVYNAGNIKHGVTLVQSGDTQLIKIRTTSKLVVYIEADTNERANFDLFEHVHAQSRTLDSHESSADVTIPLVSLDEQPDISWLVGMSVRTDEPNTAISQALQQNRLEISLDGIRASSAVALGVAKGIILEHKSIVLDKPFTLWLAYEGEEQPFPLFAAYVAPDTWNKATV